MIPKIKTAADDDGASFLKMLARICIRHHVPAEREIDLRCYASARTSIGSPPPVDAVVCNAFFSATLEHDLESARLLHRPMASVNYGNGWGWTGGIIILPVGELILRLSARERLEAAA